MYDETGAASARFLRWLTDETGGGAGNRVPSAEYAPRERCSLELVEGVVERLAALGWIAVHNDSGAVPPLISPTGTGLAEARAWATRRAGFAGAAAFAVAFSGSGGAAACVVSQWIVGTLLTGALQGEEQSSLSVPSP